MSNKMCLSLPGEDIIKHFRETTKIQMNVELCMGGTKMSIPTQNPGEGNGSPGQVFLPGEFRGQSGHN